MQSLTFNTGTLTGYINYTVDGNNVTVSEYSIESEALINSEAFIKDQFKGMNVIIKSDADIWMKGSVNSLSRLFSMIIRKWLTAEQITEVNEKNQTEAYTGLCATHDYCDANQPMIDAFKTLFGRDADTQSDEDNEIINVAWDLAKKNLFY